MYEGDLQRDAFGTNYRETWPQLDNHPFPPRVVQSKVVEMPFITSPHATGQICNCHGGWPVPAPYLHDLREGAFILVDQDFFRLELPQEFSLTQAFLKFLARGLINERKPGLMDIFGVRTVVVKGSS